MQTSYYFSRTTLASTHKGIRMTSNGWHACRSTRHHTLVSRDHHNQQRSTHQGIHEKPPSRSTMAHTKNAPAPLLGAAISSCVLLASFPLRSESFAPGNPLSRAVRDPSAIPFSDNVPFFAGFRHKSGNVAGSTGVEMASLAPSKISDPDGPTPEKAPFEPTVVDAAEVEAQMEYDPETSVVPHQPWRRGDANGCEEPVDAQWRLGASLMSFYGKMPIYIYIYIGRKLLVHMSC